MPRHVYNTRIARKCVASSLNKTPAPYCDTYLPQVRACIGLEMRDNGGLYLLPDREATQMGCVNTK